jgi:filamentous hemagglutinin
LYAPGAVGGYAQIGYHMGDVSSNLHFTNIGGNLILSGSQGSDSNTAGYALIGHGSTTQPGGIRNGNIVFDSIGGFATVQFSLESPSFTSSNSGYYFAQIGHARSFMTSPVVATGDISLTSVAGSISVTGEITDNSYALIGHGGGLSSQPDTYSGSILLNAGTDITLATRVNLSTGITPPNAFAIVGHTALMNGPGTITSHSNTIHVTAVDGIILKSERGNVSAIGPYVDTMGTAGASGAVSVGTFTVQAGSSGNLVLSSVAPNSGDPLTAAFVGAVSCTGTLPLTAAGSATSTLNVSIGKDLQLQTGSTGTSSNTFTLIQDGMGAPSGGATITVGGKATFFGGNNNASINGAGVLNLNITGPLTLDAGPTGNAQIMGSAGGTISASSLSLDGVIGGGAAQIQNTAGSLSVTATSDLLTLSNNANITQTGTGTLTVSSPMDDLVLQNSASISNQGSGSTMITVGGVATLLAGQGNGSIVNGTGPLTLNVTGNLNIVTNAGGSASITSTGPVTVTAENIRLSGLGSSPTQILTATGSMLLIAQNDFTMADNSQIRSGSGPITLVVDNQAPASIGTGRFLLAPNSSITSSSSIRIFSAEPNGITVGNLAFGKVNGSYVTAGLACAFDAPPPSSTAQYSTFYPSTFGGTPYTIFFKSPLTPAAFKMRSR